MCSVKRSAGIDPQFSDRRMIEMGQGRCRGKESTVGWVLGAHRPPMAPSPTAGA